MRAADLAYRTCLVAEHFLGETGVARRIRATGQRARTSVVERLIRQPRIAAQPVDEAVEMQPEEFFDRYYSPGIPLVFKGAASEWSCCKNWSFDYFRKNFGSAEATVVRSEGFDGPDTQHLEKRVAISDLVGSMESADPWYLRFSPLLQEHPVLIQELDLDWIRAHRRGRSLIHTTQFFMGAKGAKTHLHCDQPSNLTIQVLGRKKWTMNSSELLLALDPQILRSTYFPSHVDTRSEEGRELLSRLPRYEVTLEAGDILYNAPFTWHEVDSETDSISVVVRSSNIMPSLKGSTLLAFLRVMATNPPIWQTLRRVDDACFGYEPKH